jgi:hypothetical protein
MNDEPTKDWRDAKIPKWGGPAYPVVFRTMTPQGMMEMDFDPGMSLRDAAALAALPAIVGFIMPMTKADDSQAAVKIMAGAAYQIADALIAAREETRDE